MVDGAPGRTVTPSILLDEAELVFTPLRAAAGPGGQNVNKVATAIELRFDARRSRSLTNDVSIRLQKLAGSRLTNDGVVVIRAQSYRSQERNRQDAIDRLLELIGKAAVAPKRRRATKVPKGAKEERIRTKQQRGSVKSLRSKVRGE
ncbi:MAG: aminoacyl-tRNA hydrolase [Hyphomicrobiales bacterium]|nr:aminoacyl-tRNA hydrolase [Hyphomicrobiales bacterium]OQW84878.1 MAG: aminoacyl-tRNA hydrolase [Proteobacteria bacterium ST_bin15]